MDQAVLDNIRSLQSDTDSKLLDELVDLYLTEGQKLMASLEQATATQEAKEIQFAAHRLKGSSAYLGVTKVVTLCREIEEDAREGKLEELSSLVPQLRTEYLHAGIALRDIQKKGS